MSAGAVPDTELPEIVLVSPPAPKDRLEGERFPAAWADGVSPLKRDTIVANTVIQASTFLSFMMCYPFSNFILCMYVELRCEVSCFTQVDNYQYWRTRNEPLKMYFF